MEDYKDKYDDVQLERMLRENADRRRVTSIGNTKETSHKKIKKNAMQKALPWILVTTLILGAAGIKIVPKLKENIEYANDLKDATAIVTEVATENLEEAGLVNVDENGLLTINKGNTIEEYSKLGLVDASLGEYYAYGSALNEAVKNAKDDRLGASHDEYEKLIKASSYDGGTYNYTGLEQLCNINGLYGQNGLASGLEFKKYAEQELVNSYRNGTIDQIMQKVINDTKGK